MIQFEISHWIGLEYFWQYRKLIVILNDTISSSVCWIKIIPFAMKFFQLIQTNFKLIGIDASKRNERFNARNSFAQFMIFQLLFFTSAYLLFKAESYREYADCYYISSTILGVCINFSMVSWNMAKMFELIESVESFTQKSKFWRTFHCIKRKIHKIMNRIWKKLFDAIDSYLVILFQDRRMRHRKQFTKI